MRKFVKTDSNNIVIAAYTSEAPQKIDTEVFTTLDLKDMIGMELKDGKLVKPTLTLEGLKQEKIKEIRDYFQSKINEIKSNYSQYEIETWDTQRAEYNAYMKDNTAPTPFIDNLAQARGITKEELIQKIGNKVAYLASLIGRQQKLEDAVNKCSTESEVMSITIQ